MCFSKFIIPFLLYGLFCLQPVFSEDDSVTSDSNSNKFRIPTLGGKVMWDLVAEVEGYKLQMNKLSGHYRLLDSANVRITFGTLQKCEEALATELEQGKKSENVNWKIPTIGGKQFWSDVKIIGGWRIQQNVFSDHYRLLNKKDVRQAWGREDQCEEALKRAIESGKVKVTGKKIMFASAWNFTF